MTLERFERGHLVGDGRHLSHAPCGVQDCVQRNASWHGPEHIIPCRGCKACSAAEEI